MTRCFGRRFFLSLPIGLVLLSLISLCGEAAAHGGRFIIPSAKGPGDESSGESSNSPGTDRRVLIFPGSGPKIPFKFERWEFWWFFNKAPLIMLKPALFRLTPQAGYIDYPYEKANNKTRVMLVRFFTRLYMGEQDAGVREAAVLSLGRARDGHGSRKTRVGRSGRPR